MKTIQLKVWVAGAALLLASSLAHAQKVIQDKVYQVSKKVSGFSIIDVAVDEGANDVAVTYFTKQQKDFFGDPKKLTFEIYHFDLNYDFKKVEEEVIELERAKTRFKGFKFNGDEYKEIGVTMAMFSPTLTFVKKETTYKWNWYTNAGYYKTVKTLDKLKLKDEGYGKLYRVFSSESDATLNVIAQGAENGKPFYQFMTVDKDLNIFNESKLPLDHHVQPTTLELERPDGVKDIIMVLQPVDFKGAVKASSPTSFRLLQIDGATMKVVRDLPFESPGTALTIEKLHVEGNDLYILGKIQNSVKSMSLTNLMVPKYDAKTANLFVMKAGRSKVDYVKSFSSANLGASVSVVPGVKGKPAVTSFLLWNYITVNKGELFINTQNYTTGKNGVSKKDAVMLHLSSAGDLKKTYIYPFDGELQSKNFFSPDGKYSYWVVLDFLSKEKKGTTLFYPPAVYISKVDLGAGTASSLMQVGGEDARLYYDFPEVPRADPNSVTFFGTKGKGTIWFGQVAFD